MVKPDNDTRNGREIEYVPGRPMLQPAHVAPREVERVKALYDIGIIFLWIALQVLSVPPLVWKVDPSIAYTIELERFIGGWIPFIISVTMIACSYGVIRHLKRIQKFPKIDWEGFLSEAGFLHLIFSGILGLMPIIVVDLYPVFAYVGSLVYLVWGMFYLVMYKRNHAKQTPSRISYHLDDDGVWIRE